MRIQNAMYLWTPRRLTLAFSHILFFVVSASFSFAQTVPPPDLNFDGELCAFISTRSMDIGGWTFTLPNDPNNPQSEIVQERFDGTLSTACNYLIDTPMNTDEGWSAGANDRSLIWGEIGHVGEFAIASADGAPFDLTSLDLGALGAVGASFVLEGFRDGMSVTSAETVSFSTLADATGAITYTTVNTNFNTSLTGQFARLFFGDVFNSIDELRITTAYGYSLEIDNIDAEIADLTYPAIVSVNSTNTNGTFNAGDTIDIVVEFDEAVTVNQTPTLTLETGPVDRIATYVSGTGSQYLTFEYIVQAGDQSADLEYVNTTSLALNGGSIMDVASNSAILTLPAIFGAGSLAYNAALVIDTEAPNATTVTLPSNATYAIGQELSFTVNWPEAVFVTGTPRLSLAIGSNTRFANYASGSGSTSLVFTYAIQYDDEDGDGIAMQNQIELNSGSITDEAGNAAGLVLTGVGSTSLIFIERGSPATEFANKNAAIRQTLNDTAASGLTSAMSANQAMVQDAKGRLVAGDTPDMALDVDGSLIANPVSVSSMGSFFGQTTNGNGTRQLVFGSFDLQRDDTTGASTATFNGKIAWEREVSDTTLLGYFIGGDLAHSNIAGSFTGDQDHLGVTAGGYAVHEMAKQLYLDGFISVGAGRNNLTMDDGVLALESDYTTRSATFGISFSGVISKKRFEIWPELALTVGRTWIDTVAFTGTAYGTTDNTLSLDAGMVTLANLTFRPEFRVPLDGSEVSKSLRLITLAPRLICQQTTTTTTAQTCGGGAELGLQTHSADGTTTASAQILSDWINGQTRTSGQVSVEMRF